VVDFEPQVIQTLIPLSTSKLRTKSALKLFATSMVSYLQLIESMVVHIFVQYVFGIPTNQLFFLSDAFQSGKQKLTQLQHFRAGAA